MVSASLDAYHGVARGELAARCGAAQLVIVERCGSTMDLAHALASGAAPHGTVVVAHAQDAGRGRSGKAWASVHDAGVWASILLRRVTDAPPGVLSLRVGMALAAALEQLAPVQVGLKWPNDLYVDGGKVAGVLCEARWRGDALEHVVVGVGVNVIAPTGVQVDGGAPLAALGAVAAHGDVLRAITHAVLASASAAGPLDAAELTAFASRDIAVHRRITSPVAGTVLGITAGGALRVQADDGRAHEAVAGSLTFQQRTGE